MTEEQKAKELVAKMRLQLSGPAIDQIPENAKRCALVAVDILIEVAGNSNQLIAQLIDLLPAPDRYYFKGIDTSNAVTYWQKVKQEINKL